MREQDRPAHDGRRKRRVLRALVEPRTIRQVARALGWRWARAHSWVHYLVRTGHVRRVATDGKAGVYQRAAANTPPSNVETNRP